jgi:hypothetical protein
MATGQTLLDTMELLNQELQLQSGEADVTRALVALNRSQDYFEAILAGEKWVKGDTTGTVATVASTETTAFPTGLLRLDRLVVLNPTTSRPEYELDSNRDSVAGSSNWPVSLFDGTSTSTGKPRSYSTNGRSIYWNPLPDGVYTVRWYGFQSASDISASGTFAYDDIYILPLASFAVRLFKLGLDDDQTDIGTLAENTFRPAIKAAAGYNRDGARGFRYRYVHGE